MDNRYTVHDNDVDIIFRDITGRILIEYKTAAQIPEYPFNVEKGYREWISPFSIKVITRQ